jgi:cobalt-zinc-cadmium resistance protein CzcA
VIGLLISGEYLSVPASVGFIALWGIAVLNGVVLVLHPQPAQRGHGAMQAVVQGAKMRFRPVMMTATVAMLGWCPSCSPPDRVRKCSGPLAIVVIGGLITCTLLTLVVVPTLVQVV